MSGEKNIQSKNNNDKASSHSNFIAALLASQLSGVTHGIDTAIKRLQINSTQVNNLSQFKQIILNQKPPSSNATNSSTSQTKNLLSATTANKAVVRSGWKSLYDGFFLASLNSAVIKTARYFGQDKMQKQLQKQIAPVVGSHLTPQQTNVLCGGLSGVIAGVGEALAQPLDTYKTRIQVGADIKGNPFAGAGANALRCGLAAGSFFTIYNAVLATAKNRENPSNRDKLKATSTASILTAIVTNPADIHGDKPLKDYGVYSISKSGLIMMTRVLARELGPGIRVNAISPGMAIWPEGKNILSDGIKEEIIEKTTLKRIGKPGDIAKAALYLIRDADYVTGQVIIVDGGRSLK